MGRPTVPLIEVNQVIKTALAILEARGPDGLNMRILGKELGVNPASLYHHFKDKDEILDAVADYVLRTARTPKRNSQSSWEESAIDLAKSYRAVIMAYPNVALLVCSRRSRYRPEVVHHHYEDLLSKLCDAGFSPDRALLGMVTLEMLASGSAIEESTMGPDTQFAPVDPRKYPTLYKVSQGPKLRVRSSFAEMCHLILMGLKAVQDGIVPPLAQAPKIAKRKPGTVASRPSKIKQPRVARKAAAG